MLAAAAITVGMVWYGRFLAVPRYLVPLAPPLALILARACQLTWRRSRLVAVAGAAAYLVAVGIPLVRDVTVLWPDEPGRLPGRARPGPGPLRLPARRAGSAGPTPTSTGSPRA